MEHEGCRWEKKLCSYVHLLVVWSSMLFLAFVPFLSFPFNSLKYFFGGVGGKRKEERDIKHQVFFLFFMPFGGARYDTQSMDSFEVLFVSTLDSTF